MIIIIRKALNGHEDKENRSLHILIFEIKVLRQ